MNLEMPSKCKIGEQIGLRITVFNYLHYEIDVSTYAVIADQIIQVFIYFIIK